MYLHRDPLKDTYMKPWVEVLNQETTLHQIMKAQRRKNRAVSRARDAVTGKVLWF